MIIEKDIQTSDTCGYDTTPQDGVACEGDTEKEYVCG